MTNGGPLEASEPRQLVCSLRSVLQNSTEQSDLRTKARPVLRSLPAHTAELHRVSVFRRQSPRPRPELRSRPLEPVILVP